MGWFSRKPNKLTDEQKEHYESNHRVVGDDSFHGPDFGSAEYEDWKEHGYSEEQRETIGREDLSDAEYAEMAKDYEENPPTDVEIDGPVEIQIPEFESLERADALPNLEANALMERAEGAVITVNGRTIFDSTKRNRFADVEIEFNLVTQNVEITINELP
ncbi:hypothetical protein SEA_KEELAN_19 [Gordonia phage Keelan]|nr:hypothetical protein SEA_KEELAN_19 [Gordonia phage Keelan]